MYAKTPCVAFLLAVTFSWVGSRQKAASSDIGSVVLPNGAPCSGNFHCASGCCVCPPEEWYRLGGCSAGFCVSKALRGQICGLLRRLQSSSLGQGLFTDGAVVGGQAQMAVGARWPPFPSDQYRPR